MTPTSRILGIDPGERRVGLAVSDPLGIIAQGMDTFDRKAGEDFMTFLSGLVERLEVGEVVVGHPLSMSGRPSDTTRMAEAMAREIGERLGLPVTLWDERLTSEEARRTARGTRRASIDRIAAVLILQNFLDYRAGQRERGERE